MTACSSGESWNAFGTDSGKKEPEDSGLAIWEELVRNVPVGRRPSKRPATTAVTGLSVAVAVALTLLPGSRLFLRCALRVTDSV